MSTLTVSYQLNPPSQTTDLNGLGTSGSLEFPAKVEPHTDPKAYYAALRHSAILPAKHEIGQILTKWRDLVGKHELHKEDKKVLDDEEEGPADEE